MGGVRSKISLGFLLEVVTDANRDHQAANREPDADHHGKDELVLTVVEGERP